ncbi:DUF6752 domain-containing protein [Nocardioides sambongensis]|uniref:DUF6752 domain-containing protein n=1 Tax=Nocardioides sambongensis TaxID=2589074 RepID=UPI0038B2A5DB
MARKGDSMNEQDDSAEVYEPTRMRKMMWPLERAAGTHTLMTRMGELEARVADMEANHVRFAELVDLVQELLLPVALQDETKVAALVERFSDELDTARVVESRGDE